MVKRFTIRCLLLSTDCTYQNIIAGPSVMTIMQAMRVPFKFSRHWHRAYSSIEAPACTASFHPVQPSSSLFKHIHIKGITPYSVGNEIQENLILKNLEYKKYSIIKNNPKLQYKLLDLIVPSSFHPTIFSFEFDSIYTGGKREKVNTNEDRKQEYEHMTHIPFVQTSRGGQITYHGPGQIVIYPIIDLSGFNKLNSKCYVSTIEKSVVGLLRDKYNLDALTTENTGVWVKSRDQMDTLKKISSLGVNIRRSITSHGVSINCNLDLKYVNDKRIVMCGLGDFRQTSIKEELGRNSADGEYIPQVGRYFVDQFTKRLGVDQVDYHEVEIGDFKDIQDLHKWIENTCIYKE